MSYQLRPYQTRDFARLCEIHDAARMEELSYTDQEDAFVPLIEAAVNENLFDYTIVVAETEDRVDGFVAYKTDELGWLYVHPSYFRRGIATRLTRHVIADGGPEIFLEVLHANQPAFKLYQKLGFDLVRTVTGQMTGNEVFSVTVNELRYVKSEV